MSLNTTFAAGDVLTAAHMNGIQAVWTSYTPALTNITIGNGTLVAGYSRVGKTVEVRIRLLFGSTTSVTAAATINLPVAAIAASSQIIPCFIGSSSGTVPLVGIGYINTSASVVQPFHPTATGNGTQIQLGSAALTMGTGAYVMLQGTYEAA